MWKKENCSLIIDKFNHAHMTNQSLCSNQSYFKPTRSFFFFNMNVIQKYGATQLLITLKNAYFKSFALKKLTN